MRLINYSYSETVLKLKETVSKYQPSVEIYSNRLITSELFKRNSEILVAIVSRTAKENMSTAIKIDELLSYLLIEYYGKYEPEYDEDYCVPAEISRRSYETSIDLDGYLKLVPISIYKDGKWNIGD